MNTELLEALNILEKEKDISKETLLDAIENSTKTAVAPAPQSNDIEWLDVLETACNIIF